MQQRITLLSHRYLGQDLTEDVTFSGSAAVAHAEHERSQAGSRSRRSPTVTGGTLRIEGAGEINQNTASNATAFPAIKLTGGKLRLRATSQRVRLRQQLTHASSAIYATDGELILRNVSPERRSDDYRNR